MLAMSRAQSDGGGESVGGTMNRGKPKKEESTSLLEKFGTIGRKKKQPQPSQAEVEENEAIEVEREGVEALDSTMILPTPKKVVLEEGEERRFLMKESREDPKVQEVITLLIHWLNRELAEHRIVVKHIQEDLFDGQVIQRLIEKLANIKIEVPEVSQSEEGQRRKLHTVIEAANRILSQAIVDRPKWTADSIHAKDILAIMHLLIALAIHFRAPVRFPEYVNAQVMIVSKKDGKMQQRITTEQLTTCQTELGLKGERDAFDTLFDYGPAKLTHVKNSLVAFCNKHLNKINLEVTELDTQFQDGVYLVLLMGLLEGYFVPLYNFHLQVTDQRQMHENVAFAFRLMEDAGMPRPRSRVEDIVNGDLKSTLRLLHSLFTKYKHV
ncbi:hypothetical protein QR680_002438 [Steinernema hermaphroditum]|uniref:Calponin-homology (CH) domain-containing protein n=1 Tax=Steinernema hermaphroditum TaxID=289476 RepID=A0AA39H3M2_9BILA|nr:hypothetical protein QR680_002438 [Steinernema hermaphroditum]